MGYVGLTQTAGLTVYFSAAIPLIFLTLIVFFLSEMLSRRAISKSLPLENLSKV